MAAGLLSMQTDPGTRASLCRMWLCTPAGKPLSGSSCQRVGGRAAPNLLQSCWHPLRQAGIAVVQGAALAELAQGCFRLCSEDSILHKILSPSPGGCSRRRLLFPSPAELEKPGAGFYSLQRGIQLLLALTSHPWSRSPPSWGGWLGAAPCLRSWAHLSSRSSPSVSPLQGWHVPSRWH